VGGFYRRHGVARLNERLLGPCAGALGFGEAPLRLRKLAFKGADALAARRAVRLESLDAKRPPSELLHVVVLFRERFLGLALDAALEHRELGAQMVLFRRQLGNREGKLGLDAPTCETLGAGVHGGQDHERDQGRGQEPQPEDHDGFNHATASPVPTEWPAPCHARV
jgi:hypothetical protein